jgi:O-antigen ligase
MLLALGAALISYCRGAWLGLAVAAVPAVWPVGLLWRQSKKLRRILVVAVVVSGVAGVWFVASGSGVGAISLNLLRRLESVGNADDFSWRNRIHTWKGGLQMIADHPIWGVGWAERLPLFDGFYRSEALIEGNPLELNDYLSWTIAIGLPAGALLWSGIAASLLGRHLAPSGDSTGSLLKPDSHATLVQAISMPAALVLLASFGFDGGLGILPISVAFGVLVGASDSFRLMPSLRPGK